VQMKKRKEENKLKGQRRWKDVSRGHKGEKMTPDRSVGEGKGMITGGVMFLRRSISDGREREGVLINKP